MREFLIILLMFSINFVFLEPRGGQCPPLNGSGGGIALIASPLCPPLSGCVQMRYESEGRGGRNTQLKWGMKRVIVQKNK